MFLKKPEKGGARETKFPGGQPTAPILPLSASTFIAKTSAFVNGPEKAVSSIIGADLIIKGNVNSKGEVQVDGEVQGDVHCNCLVVGDRATLIGGVVAEDVIIRGRVQGSIRAQRVTLQSSAHVKGDIHHSSLSMEQGAYFEGKSRRSDTPTAAAKGDPAAAPPSVSAKPSKRIN